MRLETRFLTNNPCYKTNRDIEVRGLMLHSVGVNQPDPMVFIRSWDKPDYDRACVHGFMAGDAYITLPCMEKVGRAKRLARRRKRKQHAHRDRDDGAAGDTVHRRRYIQGPGPQSRDGVCPEDDSDRCGAVRDAVRLSSP